MKNHLLAGSTWAKISCTLLICLSLGAACDQKAAQPPVSKTACEDYSKRICKEAGEQSQTCAGAKGFIDMMPPEACSAGLTKIDFTVAKLKDLTKKCDELTTKLCTDIGPTTPTCELVKTRTKEFPPDQCVAMLAQYDRVLDELKRQEAKNKPVAPEVFAKAAAADAASFGAADAKVTVVEFSDFQCPFCSKAAETAHKVKEKYGDKVRFVFRQFPLSFHKNAHAAAEASLFAHQKGKFWELHDKFFEHQQELEPEKLEGYAKEVGLDVGGLKKALADKTFAAAVDADMKLGEEVGVDGTPTMFVNGARVPNPTDFDALSKQIDSMLSAN